MSNCTIGGNVHNHVTIVHSGPLRQLCLDCGAWRDTGEHLGRGLVRFSTADTAQAFAWRYRVLMQSQSALTRVESDGPHVIIDALGTDEEVGARLFEAASMWLAWRGDEAEKVERLCFQRPERTGGPVIEVVDHG